MNIFKVLALRKKFPEEMASVLLAWLLSPEQEHGLDRLFLEKFVAAVVAENTEAASELRITPNEEIKCVVEENVTVAFIDIVYFFSSYVFAIENKIHEEAIMENQLQREYSGLREKYPDKKIILTYLVRHKSPMAKMEYGDLEKIVEHPHLSYFVTWSGTVSKTIDSILADERSRRINPLQTQTKLMLESLNAFILDNFSGYEFIEKRGWNGIASDFPRYTLAELRTKTQGFVGLAAKYAKLQNMTREDIVSTSFQYDDALVCNRHNWFPLKEFLGFADRRLSSNYDPVQATGKAHSARRGSQSEGYMGKINSAQIYSMVCDPSCGSIFIGIKQGEKGFMNMERNRIDTMSWQVTTGQQPNSQWISGERYKHLYERVFPERKT